MKNYFFAFIFLCNNFYLISLPNNPYLKALNTCQLQTTIHTSPLSLEPHRFTTPNFITPNMTESDFIISEYIMPEFTVKKNGRPENHDYQFSSDMTFAYKQNMNSNKITKALFGNYLYMQNNNPYLLIQGSKVENRKEQALLADYFYLSDTFESKICFNPTIQTAFINFNVTFNLDTFIEGLYFNLYGPFAHTEWKLNAQEYMINNSPGSIERARFSPQQIDNAHLQANALDFFAGQTPPVIIQNLMDPSSGAFKDYPSGWIAIIRDPLLFHTFDTNKNIFTSTSKNGFDELRADLGYTFINNDQGFGKIYVTGAAPVAQNIQSSALLFTPQLGDNKHWQAGVGLTGSCYCWQSHNKHHNLELQGNIQATHLFDMKQQRTFDLKNKPLSRYMLAAKLRPSPGGGITRLVDSDLLEANYQFNYNTTPVANLTTQNIKIACSAQLEAAALLNYQYKNLISNIGYSFWMQTKEKIKTIEGQSSFNNNDSRWVLHGDTRVFGYQPRGRHPGLDGVAIPLPVSNNNATITHVTSQQTDSEGKNYGVDNADYALTHTFNNPTAQSYLTQFNQEDKLENQIKISVDPIFISDSDIDFTGSPLLVSHKLFGSLGYIHEYKKATPFISVGGEAELGTFVWQWSVWTKLGVAF